MLLCLGHLVSTYIIAFVATHKLCVLKNRVTIEHSLLSITHVCDKTRPRRGWSYLNISIPIAGYERVVSRWTAPKLDKYGPWTWRHYGILGLRTSGNNSVVRSCEMHLPGI
ncbi:hypothetical protein ARMSODRAFT_418860 [Armillaria solidipes]|uniref:Secreted protein n=1 Tax=Armillaria solidipes TaxID=1076256 RepID=A0A2H3CGT0_9AGAR|nr:hypothetical protein ARMSODRAFT_418860 [Armillaria solidipes]